MNVGEYIRNKERKSEPKPEERKDYFGMNEEQLLQELFRVSNSSNITNEELDGFYRKVKPYLTPEQSEKMRNLISQLKR